MIIQEPKFFIKPKMFIMTVLEDMSGKKYVINLTTVVRINFKVDIIDKCINNFSKTGC